MNLEALLADVREAYRVWGMTEARDVAGGKKAWGEFEGAVERYEAELKRMGGTI